MIWINFFKGKSFIDGVSNEVKNGLNPIEDISKFDYFSGLPFAEYNSDITKTNVIT